MGKVNTLFQEEAEALAEAYLKAHPETDPADAYEAAYAALGVRVEQD